MKKFIKKTSVVTAVIFDGLMGSLDELLIKNCALSLENLLVETEQTFILNYTFINSENRTTIKCIALTVGDIVYKKLDGRILRADSIAFEKKYIAFECVLNDFCKTQEKDHPLGITLSNINAVRLSLSKYDESFYPVFLHNYNDEGKLVVLTQVFLRSFTQTILSLENGIYRVAQYEKDDLNTNGIENSVPMEAYDIKVTDQIKKDLSEIK